MARPERPLDPQAPLGAAGFASELRALRRDAGSPSYRAMAAKTYFAATTLSEAAAGRRMPTLEVTLAYVEACGGDQADWERRWRAATSPAPAAESLAGESLAGEPRADEPRAAEPQAVELAAGPGAAGTPAPVAAAPRRAARWRALASSLGALVVVAGVILVSSGVFTTKPAAGSPSPARVAAVRSSAAPVTPGVSDGQDPKDAGCGGDAQTLVSTPLRSAAGFTYGVLELRYSPSCHSGWARYTPDANQPQPTTVTISVNRNTPVGATSVTFPVYTGGIYSDMELFKGGCVTVAAATGGVTPPAVARTLCSPEPAH